VVTDCLCQQNTIWKESYENGSYFVFTDTGYLPQPGAVSCIFAPSDCGQFPVLGRLDAPPSIWRLVMTDIKKVKKQINFADKAIKKRRTDIQYASVMIPERFVQQRAAVASSAPHLSGFPESRQKSVLFA